MLEFRSVSRRVVVCSLWSLLSAALARSFLVSREDERASETSVEEWEGGGGTAAILCFTAQNTSKVLSLPGEGTFWNIFRDLDVISIITLVQALGVRLYQRASAPDSGQSS